MLYKSTLSTCVLFMSKHRKSAVQESFTSKVLRATNILGAPPFCRGRWVVGDPGHGVEGKLLREPGSGTRPGWDPRQPAGSEGEPRRKR